MNINKFKSKTIKPLDKEEEELMFAEEKGEFKNLPKKEEILLKEQLLEAAKASVATRKMISIKIPEQDLLLLKAEAHRKGLRYQSLINSILHQYVTGHLKAI